MNQTQMKRRVAQLLIQQAGSLVEFWDEMGGEGIDAEFACECLARWMDRLPGDAWDTRLNDPTRPEQPTEAAPEPTAEENPMDFRQAITAASAELTSQPWDYTNGATLTVIPEGLRADPGCAEVAVRVTASHTLAAEAGVTTAAMPQLLDALGAGTAWQYTASVGDVLTVSTLPDGGALLTVVETVVEVDYDGANRPREVTAAIRLPEGQRMPLVSALRRAADVAAGWEN